MKMRVLKKISRKLYPGDEFEANEKEARLLMALKLAQPCDTRTEFVEPVVVEPPTRRRYQRRDLTAAD